MALRDGATDRAMKDKIKQNGHAFSFFQAVSLLEKHYLSLPDSQYKGVGKNTSFSEEYIRFSVSPNLGFPKSDIEFIEHFKFNDAQSIERDYTKIEVHFLGLHGSSSPLPSCYTEKLAGREEKDNPVKQFLDFFHQRIISMFYQIWKKYRFHILYESGASDPFSGRMLHLLGLSSVMQEAKAAELDKAKLLSYVNQLSGRTRSPTLISGIIAHYFNLKNVHIEQWIYRRIEIHDTQKNTLNKKNCTLGTDLHLGASRPDLVGKFNLCFEHIDFKTYCMFLPGGEKASILLNLMRFILRDPLVWDLKMRLNLTAIPLNRLGRKEKLGQTIWLGSPTAKDAQTRLIGQL